MERRDVLASGATGTLLGLSGCSGLLTGGGDSERDLSVSASTEHVGGRYPTYVTLALEPGDYGGEHVSFDELSSAARREFTLAVAGRWYRSYESTALRDELRDYYVPIVSYEDRAFEHVSQVIGADSRYEDDWTDPVALDASVTGDHLELELRNVGDDSLRLLDGPPYFGVLLAENDGETAVLDHDAYAAHEAIVVDDGFVYTDYEVWLDDRSETVLAPGESIETRYDVPDVVSSGWTVRVDVEYETDAAWPGLWDLTFSTDG